MGTKERRVLNEADDEEKRRKMRTGDAMTRRGSDKKGDFEKTKNTGTEANANTRQQLELNFFSD